MKQTICEIVFSLFTLIGFTISASEKENTAARLKPGSRFLTQEIKIELTMLIIVPIFAWILWPTEKEKLINFSLCETTTPGIVNRTFRNRTKSNPIESNGFWQSSQIEHRTLSDSDFRTNRIQSNKTNQTEQNPLDCVRLSSAAEFNRKQSNVLRLIVW